MNIETAWITDVLRDLQSFCAKNGLVNAAQKLAETNDFISEELDEGRASSRVNSVLQEPSTPCELPMPLTKR